MENIKIWYYVVGFVNESLASENSARTAREQCFRHVNKETNNIMETHLHAQHERRSKKRAPTEDQKASGRGVQHCDKQCGRRRLAAHPRTWSPPRPLPPSPRLIPSLRLLSSALLCPPLSLAEWNEGKRRRQPEAFLPPTVRLHHHTTGWEDATGLTHLDSSLSLSSCF